MEIKLNHYTLPVLCGIVSSITYAILYFSSESFQKAKNSKGPSKTKVSDDLSSDDDSDTEYHMHMSRLRKDSVHLAKHKRKLSNEKSSNEALDSKEILNNDEDDESDSSTENCKFKSLKTRKDSLHLTPLSRTSSNGKTFNRRDVYDQGNLNWDVSQGNAKNSNHDQEDDFETNDPAQLLQERINRSKRNKKGAGGRRATIAFADELQATLADHLKTFDTTEDKPANNALLSPAIDTSDKKPILKQYDYDDDESKLRVICRKYDNGYRLNYSNY